MSKGLNRREVQENVRKAIAMLEARKAEGRKASLKIDDVYRDFSIFDWWKNDLSLSNLRAMDKFLTVAGELGYNGYVCFKVGVAGCSHGMWANKAESVDGHSPDGEVLFHSFRAGDNYWDVCLPNGSWLGNRDKWEFTLKEVKAALGV